MISEKEKQRQQDAFENWGPEDLIKLDEGGKAPLGMGNNDHEQLSEMMNQLTSFFF